MYAVGANARQEGKGQVKRHHIQAQPEEINDSLAKHSPRRSRTPSTMCIPLLRVPTRHTPLAPRSGCRIPVLHGTRLVGVRAADGGPARVQRQPRPAPEDRRLHHPQTRLLVKAIFFALCGLRVRTARGLIRERPKHRSGSRLGPPLVRPGPIVRRGLLDVVAAFRRKYWKIAGLRGLRRPILAQVEWPPRCRRGGGIHNGRDSERRSGRYRSTRGHSASAAAF